MAAAMEIEVRPLALQDHTLPRILAISEAATAGDLQRLLGQKYGSYKLFYKVGCAVFAIVSPTCICSVRGAECACTCT